MAKKKKVKHTFRTKTVDLGTCGSHYCDGHDERFVVCSCGWKHQYYHYDEVEKIKLLHRVAVLEKLL